MNLFNKTGLFLLSYIVMAFTQTDSVKNQQFVSSEKTVLVYVFDVVGAKRSIAENLTEKFYQEMNSLPGLKAIYIKN
ncbi:MAG: hypothetical protein HQK83_20520, partial [Fibrobacteria bacterium]|nr:hypothetical protein [Fibrobacteria bacterium]